MRDISLCCCESKTKIMICVDFNIYKLARKNHNCNF
jgi:hypothetical protein